MTDLRSWYVVVMKASSPCLATIVAAATMLVCGCAHPPPTAPAPQSGATPAVQPDAALPPPAASSRKGVIVPGDTGVGAMPSGSDSSTGTSGGSLGKSLGNSNNSGN